MCGSSGSFTEATEGCTRPRPTLSSRKTSAVSSVTSCRVHKMLSNPRCSCHLAPHLTAATAGLQQRTSRSISSVQMAA